VVSVKAHTTREALRNLLATWFELLDAEKAAGVEEVDQVVTVGSPFGKEPVAMPKPPRTPVSAKGTLTDLLQQSLDALKKK
jgi:hypothetical protein